MSDQITPDLNAPSLFNEIDLLLFILAAKFTTFCLQTGAEFRVLMYLYFKTTFRL